MKRFSRERVKIREYYYSVVLLRKGFDCEGGEEISEDGEDLKEL